MRIFDFNGSSKAIANAVAQTITFTSSDIPGDNVVAYHLITDPTNNSAIDFSTITLKAGGSPIWSLTGIQLRNFIEATSRGNYATADAAQGLTLPLYDMLASSYDEADLQQFPKGQLPTLEIGLASTTVTGSIVCGWTMTDQPAAWYPRMLSQAHGIPVAVQSNARMPFTSLFDFRGFSVPTAGLIRAKCTVGGVQLLNLQGPARAVTSGSMIQQATRDTGVFTIADPIWTCFRNSRQPIIGGSGNTYVELDLDGTQAAGGAICIYDRVRQG